MQDRWKEAHAPITSVIRSTVSIQYRFVTDKRTDRYMTTAYAALTRIPPRYMTRYLRITNCCSTDSERPHRCPQPNKIGSRRMSLYYSVGRKIVCPKNCPDGQTLDDRTYRCGLIIAVNLTCIGLPRFIEIHSRWRLKVDRVRLIFLRLSGRECGPE